MPHESRGAAAERCFNFTESAVERVLRAAAAASEDGQGGDQRQLWRDEAGNGLYLRVGPTGGTYYRISKSRGKKIKKRIGDATTMKVSEARKRAKRLAGGDASAAAAPIRVRTDGPTVAAAWRAYIADSLAGRFRMAKTSPQESTLKSYEELYRPHIQPRFGHKSLHHLARRVTEIYQQLADRPPTANRVLIVLKNLYVHAARNGYWDGPNPTIDPITGKSIQKYHIKSRRRYMTTGEMARVFAAVSKECDPWPDFFPLLLLTGVRKGTLRHARWEEFDLDAPQPVWHIPHTKNGESLMLPLTETAVEILRARLARCSVKAKGVRKPISEWVFPRKGKPTIPIRDTREAWQRIVDAAGVEGIRMHDVRRTHGTVATLGGATIQEVGASLGHKTITATQVYARADISSAKRAAAIVESRYIAAKTAVIEPTSSVHKKARRRARRAK